MKPYYIYLRKSRADREAEQHGEGETLARHEKALIEYANRNHMHITKIFRELVSGETIAARPQMQTLLLEVEQGLCEGVLVMEVERLARGDTKDQGTVAEAFKYGNVKIITPMKIYDPTNEFDEEYFEFGLFMSRREYKTINRRIQRGRIASVKEGKFISSVAPYGYEKVRIPNDKGYTLKIHPEHADVIRMIFSWYTQGELQSDGTHQKLGAVSIGKKLDSMHIKPAISSYWSAASIRDILKNPVYIGQIRWAFRKEVRTIEDGVITTHRPDNKEDYIQCKGLHEPLISEATFEAAQRMLKANRHMPQKTGTGLKNSLSGILVCSKCGAKFTRLAPNTKTTYAFLKCPNPYCDNVSSPMDLVEEHLLQALKNWLRNYKLNLQDSSVHFPTEKELNLKAYAIEQSNKELNDLRKQLENTYSLVEKGVYTVDVFMKRNELLSCQINSLEEDLSALTEELKNAQAVQRSKEQFIPRTERIIDTYWSMEDISIRNSMLKEILEKVEYLKTERNTRGNRNHANFTLSIYPKIPKI